VVKLVYVFDFLSACEDMLSEAFRVLRPTRFATVLVGQMRKELHFYDIPAELAVMGRRVGLELYDKVVKPIVRERSDNAYSRMLAGRHNFHLNKFEALLIFRKTSALP